MSVSTVRIEPAELAETIMRFLDEYGDDAEEALEESMEKVATRASTELKQGGPYNDPNPKNYTNKWKVNIERTRLGIEANVYNSKSPGLAHLLEFGHAKYKGGRKEGSTRAFSHIAPVNDKIEGWMETELNSRL